MRKFIVIIFASEDQAYEGTRALKELHRDGSIALYGEAVITKDAQGAIAVREAASCSTSSAAVGAIAGGLIGLLGGPVGVAIGLAGGAALGGVRDLFDVGVSGEFVQQISDELTPSRTAIIAEIGEEWATPLDNRMQPLGGVIVREFRRDVEDEQIAREVEAAKTEFQRLRVELKDAGDEAAEELNQRIAAAKRYLEDAGERAQAEAQRLRSDAESRLETLQEQADAAAESAGKRIDQRMAALRQEYESRAAKLEKAWGLAKEALR